MIQTNLFSDRPTVGSWAWRPPNELPELAADDDLIVDMETTGLDVFGDDKPCGLGVRSRNRKKGWYLPFGHEGGGNLDEELVRRWAKIELRDKHVSNVNIKFDFQMLRKWGVDLEAQGCTLHEVQHMAALLDEHRRSFSLDNMAFSMIGKHKRELPKGTPVHQLPSYAVGEYNEGDLELADELVEFMEPKVKAEKLERVLKLEDDLLYCVAEMERNGAPVDEEKLHLWIKQTELAWQTLIMDIWRATYLRVNPDKPRDMEKLYHHLKLPYGITEKGNPSFTKEALTANQHPLVQKAFHARQIGDLRSNFLLKYSRAIKNGMLRYSLHQLRNDLYGTITGRFSASNINVQQVPKPSKQSSATLEWIIRELFIPTVGAYWLSADASQIEFRLFAHYSNSKRLIGAYVNNPWIDFHQFVTDIIRTVIPGYKRVFAKNFNFMKLYGGGAGRASAMLGVPVEEVEPLIEEYNNAFPEAGRLLNKASRLAERRGYVKTHLGRRRRYRQGDRFYSALNAVIQGTAADVMKVKLIELYRERKRLELVMRFPVHDEIDGDLYNPEKIKEVREVLNAQSLPFAVPILWEVELSKNWRCGWVPDPVNEGTVGAAPPSAPPSTSEREHRRGYSSSKTIENRRKVNG